MKRSYRKQRKNRTRHVGRMRLLLLLAGLAVAVFGLAKLAGYGWDLLAARQASKDLQDVYRSAPTDGPIQETPEPTAALTPGPTPIETAALTPSPSPVPTLTAVAYPNNPKLQISSRFKALRRENKDVIGWLRLSDLLDEPVVQRNDVFYLSHDAKGKKNVNGAIFLEAAIELKIRPYTYILYGHNMKSSAMFGCLRNYESKAYYHAEPFVSFDTIYEEGRYVIFAVGSVSIEEYGRHFVDFHDLKSMDWEARQNAIDALISASVFTCSIDVRADDQILLLVTCTEKDQDRRVVAARRIRDGEDENELKQLVDNSWKK